MASIMSSNVSIPISCMEQYCINGMEQLEQNYTYSGTNRTKKIWPLLDMVTIMRWSY